MRLSVLYEKPSLSNAGDAEVAGISGDSIRATATPSSFGYPEMQVRIPVHQASRFLDAALRNEDKKSATVSCRRIFLKFYPRLAILSQHSAILARFGAYWGKVHACNVD